MDPHYPRAARFSGVLRCLHAIGFVSDHVFVIYRFDAEMLMYRCVLGRLCLLIVLVGAPCAGPQVLWAGPPAVMLGERYHAGIDPADYWVSEKLDGVRALWDGRQLHFRSGQPIPAPAWFVAGLPRRALDGELWLGRGRFEELVGVVRTTVPDDMAWQQVKYMLFDLPDLSGSFSERVAAMPAVIAAANVPWLQMIPQQRVADRDGLRRLYREVVRAGGEGLMLHRADALRVAGRSDALLKHVPWLDAEARVVGHVAGKGKYRGMVGALEVEAPDGRRFSVGSGLTDAQRRQAPPLGSVITYRYRALTARGLPRFPTFLRMRELP